MRAQRALQIVRLNLCIVGKRATRAAPATSSSTNGMRIGGISSTPPRTNRPWPAAVSTGSPPRTRPSNCTWTAASMCVLVWSEASIASTANVTSPPPRRFEGDTIQRREPARARVRPLRHPLVDLGAEIEDTRLRQRSEHIADGGIESARLFGLSATIGESCLVVVTIAARGRTSRAASGRRLSLRNPRSQSSAAERCITSAAAARTASRATRAS